MTTKAMNFDSLNSTKFEEFSFDLLSELGFENVNWRKGTPLSSSPSDQGRDIQAQLLSQDIDKSSHFENWFFECKHHKVGVPADKLQSGLAWATSERPDVLVFIVSGYLSNSAKNHLENYIANNKPSFRIKYWENKKLYELTKTYDVLRNKYQIDNDLYFLNDTNRFHQMYSLRYQFNRVESLIRILDDFDPTHRDRAFGFEYMTIIKPRFRKPVHGNETFEDLRIDDVDYTAFRKKLLSDKYINDTEIVRNIMIRALSYTLDYGCKTEISSKIQKQEWIIEGLDKLLKEEAIADNKETYIKMIRDTQIRIDEIPETVKKFHCTYTELCNQVVKRLLELSPEQVDLASLKSFFER